MGDIFLPELISKKDNRVYGRIKNPKKIKNFRTSEEWYARK